jgi:hypothetical protein
VACVFILSGCASKPVLLSKNATVPVGVDFTGRWILRNDSASRRLSENGGVEESLVPMTRTQHSRRRRDSAGVSAQVFLEFGESLKITQTPYGLFISYDRSVVEEYTFGENRLVTIGPIEAMRVSGWEGDAFVVETLDDSGTTLFESWHLERNKAPLVRRIRISKGEDESFVHQQVFDRL